MSNYHQTAVTRIAAVALIFSTPQAHLYQFTVNHFKGVPRPSPPKSPVAVPRPSPPKSPLPVPHPSPPKSPVPVPLAPQLIYRKGLHAWDEAI